MRRVVAVVIVLVAGALVLSYLRAPHSGGPNAGGWYEARPVYGAVGSGFAMEVTSRQAAPTPGGTSDAVLQIVFRNQGRARFGTRPSDFQVLQDTGGLLSPDFSIPACPQWQDVEVDPGTLSRPVPLCFPGVDAEGSITLLWRPDVAPAMLATVNRLELPAQPGAG